jgi:hypothetical protein
MSTPNAVRLEDGTVPKQEVHWYEAHGIELRKLYEIIEDPSAEKHSQIRVVDESGEDYLYPKSWFLPIELPQRVEDELVNLVSK